MVAGRGNAPEVVERGANAWFERARTVLGERLGDSRFDPDRGLRVTVVDMTDDDTTALTESARRLGILDWVRIERANPADVAKWDQLRHDLERLSAATPHVLTRYPTLEPGYQRPPVSVHVTATALETAVDLHARYGDFVALQVGALPYPPSTERARTTAENQDLIDPAEFHVVLESPLTVGSGRTVGHAVLLTNLGDQDVRVRTNGHLTASVVDPDGRVVGGSAGWEITPLIVFSARPSVTVRIPVLVGTTSFVPELGYVVPPGTWHLTVPIKLDDGRTLVSPPLEFTVEPELPGDHA